MAPSTSIQRNFLTGYLGYREPIYCASINAVVASCGNNLRVVNATTGVLLATLSGHTRKVTGLCLSHVNRYQLFSTSLDGTLRLWDLQDAVCLSVVQVGHPVLYCHRASTEEEDGDGNDRFYMVTRTTPETAPAPDACNAMAVDTVHGWKVAAYALSKSTLELKNTIYENVDGDFCHGFAVSQRGRGTDIVAVISEKNIRIWNSSTSKLITLNHNVVLSTVAVHPTEDCIATGDRAGQIVLWRWNQGDGVVSQPNNNNNPNAKKKKRASKALSTVMHWHSHAVNGVTFSSDGSYLFSGGEEAVLVIWQLNSGKRSFLPRLGGPLQHIAPLGNGQQYVVSLLDNSLALINIPTMEKQWEFRGLQLASRRTKLPGVRRNRFLRSGLVFEPKNGLAVVQGMPGKLQFYDLVDDRHRFTLDVSERSLVSRTDGETMEPTQVELVCFDRAGDNLVTVERRPSVHNPKTGDILYHEKIALRFYEWNSQDSQYKLNTFVDSPHKTTVSSVLYHPTRNIVVTCSRDNTFKVWQKVASEARSDMTNNPIACKKPLWACRSVGFYRGLPILDASLSPDGSLLAIVYQQVITLWDPLTNSMKAGLTHISHSITLEEDATEEPRKDFVKQVEFFPAGIPFLVSHTGDGLYVWNLLTLQVSWSLRMKVTAMAVDPNGSGQFVVAVQEESAGCGGGSCCDTLLIMFHYSNSTPLLVWRVPKTLYKNIAYPHAKHASLTSETEGNPLDSLWCVDSKNELSRVWQGVVASEANAMEISSSAATTSKLAGMFGDSNNTSVATNATEDNAEAAAAKPAASHANADAHKKNAIEEVFHAYPSHMLPSTASLFSSILSSVNIADDDTAMDEDSPMDCAKASESHLPASVRESFEVKSFFPNAPSTTDDAAAKKQPLKKKSANKPSGFPKSEFKGSFSTFSATSFIDAFKDVASVDKKKVTSKKAPKTAKEPEEVEEPHSEDMNGAQESPKRKKKTVKAAVAARKKSVESATPRKSTRRSARTPRA